MHRWQENGPQDGGSQDPSNLQAPSGTNAWEEQRARIREFLQQDDEMPAFGKRRFPARLAPSAVADGGHALNTPFRRPSAVTGDFFERLRDTPSEYEMAAHDGGEAGNGWRNILRFMLPLALVAVVLPQLGLLFLDGSSAPTPAAQMPDPITTASVTPLGGQHGSLEVTQVSLITMIRGGERYLTVRGRITNTGGPASGPLALRVEIADNAGIILQGWDHRLPDTSLSSNASMRFSTLARDESGRAASARIIVVESENN
ncbi:MAG: hypothetical protein H6888_12205 [Nitratireductor sp.]|nr:hypothetical protein [Nitratireductor sp.]